MLLDSLLRGVRDLRSRRRGAAGGRRCPSRAQGRLLRCEPLEERQLLSFDPGVDWATYLGGSNIEQGCAIAVDSTGNTFVTGLTQSADFAGATNSYHGGSDDAFLAKVKPDGSLAWATYLGGSGNDTGLGIALDGAGNVLVTGGTYSSDFAGANNSYHGGSGDAFVAKVSSIDGSVVWATYLGGSGSDGGCGGIAVDRDGNALVAGVTSSSDFAGANNSYHGGTYDAFVAKVSSIDGSLVWATYLGGSNKDWGEGIAVDGVGDAFVTGYTSSSDFTGTTPNSFHGGNIDAFVAKVTSDGSLAWATYLGGTGNDTGFGIAVDGAGNALVTGDTGSLDFAGANNAYHGGINYDAFVAKVSSDGSLAWATYLGGSGNDVGYGIALDGDGNALVSGGTGSLDFAGANNSLHGGAYLDAFVAKVTPGGSSAWATYLGGSNSDVGQAITMDGAGNVLVSGYSLSLDFAGANNANHGGIYNYDAFLVKLNPAAYDATRFHVVNDASQDQTYDYNSGGVLNVSYNLTSGNTAPRGVASTITGDKTWVVDANRKVYVYDTSGGLLGSWTAGTLASSATVEDITVCGNDVWIVDAKSDKVFRYSGAASRLKDSQNAASSFKLNSGNTSPKGIVTDGTSLWVVDDGTTDKVFKYTLSGSLVGSWTISTSGAASPTGLTIDPTGASQAIWIVDSGTDKVYQYANARGLTSGSQAAAATFALAAGNTNPQGIADPPAPGSMLATGRRAGRLTDAALRALVFYDFESQSKPAPGKGLAMIPAIDLALMDLAS